MHRILQRQIKKAFEHPDQLSPEVQHLIEAVDETYRHFDEDRKLIERSLELSSSELLESNKKLRQEVEEAQKKTKELEEMNELMVDRELRMIELKEDLEKYKKRSDEPLIQKPVSTDV